MRNQAKARYDAAKSHYDRAKGDFDAQHNRYKQIIATFQQEKSRREQEASRQTPNLDTLIAEIKSKKKSTDDQIKELQASLEEQLKSLKDEYEKTAASIEEKWGENSDQLFTTLMSLQSGEVKLNVVANQILETCGPNLGTNGGGLVTCLNKMDSCMTQIGGLKRHLTDRIQHYQQLSQQLEASVNRSKNDQRLIEELMREHEELKSRFTQELKRKSEELSQKTTELSSQIPPEAKLVQEIYDLKAQIVQLEFQIISKVILSEWNGLGGFEEKVKPSCYSGKSFRRKSVSS